MTVREKLNLDMKGLIAHGPVTIVAFGDSVTHGALSVEDERYGYSYPKKMGFVGTNDQTCEIVYLSFADDDLDYIESLSDFISNSCGFKHIR